jgi:Terminase-like family.
MRSTFPELREVMDRAFSLFPRLGASWRASDKRWTFPPHDSTIEFGYGETWSEVQQYVGQEFTWLGYDELGKMPEERSWLLLLSRLRSKVAGTRVYARASANPGGAGHAWLDRRFIKPTKKGTQVVAAEFKDPLTGEARVLTRRFIPSKVTDNKILLQNNPLYYAQLQQLPETLRRQLLEGDWESGSGFALSELGETSHYVAPFEIPDHWYRFGGYDWGFAHPWWFVGGAQDENGDVYVTHAVHDRRDQIDAIASKITDLTELHDKKPRSVRWQVIAGGHDAWHDRKAHGENGPTDAERLQGYGLPLIKATISRVSGLTNLRWYTTLNGVKHPRLRFFDTPSVRALVEQVRTITTNPDNPEDALKVDADPDTGLGGDDGYDALRYMMMLRPYTTVPTSQRIWTPSNISTGQDSVLVIPDENDIAAFSGGQWLGGM